MIVDVRGRPDRHPIGVADVAPYLDRVGPGTIVVLHTGRSGPATTPTSAPTPAARCSTAACARSASTPRTSTRPRARATRCHHLVAAAGGVIVENLTNLAAVDFPDPFLSVLPLRLTGADGAPVRAVALDLRAG